MLSNRFSERAGGLPVRAAAILLVVATIAAEGCTMCPDPFDYSGPVPNGSVTQNDFAARSNGTRPVRATPFPWPPFVDASEPRPTPADDAEETVLVSAEEPVAEETTAEEPTSEGTRR